MIAKNKIAKAVSLIAIFSVLFSSFSPIIAIAEETVEETIPNSEPASEEIVSSEENIAPVGDSASFAEDSAPTQEAGALLETASVASTLCPSEMTIVSDNTNSVDGGFAVATYSEHVDWTASIPGATWIWKTYYVENPIQGETKTFSKTFNISPTAAINSALLTVAADNSYSVSVNGTQIGSDSGIFNFLNENKDNYNVTSHLTPGLNTISFAVTNKAMENGTAEINPAGLLYKLSISILDDCGGGGDDEEPANTPPAIILNGDNPMSLTAGDPFVDPGATASDAEDGDLTANIIVGGSVDNNVPANYTLTYSVSDSDGASVSVNRVVTVLQKEDNGGDEEPDLSCKIISPDQLGWYGTYYNYSSTTNGMNLPDSQWSNPYGDPLSSGSGSSGWYTNQYAKFSQIDSSLTFGNNFFPFDSTADEIMNGHDYHFGVRWSAKVTASAAGEYGFRVVSDDDSWIYVNGQLVGDNSGLHSAKTLNATTTLSAGSNLVEVFFTERHISKSYMYFKFNDESLIIKPYSPICITNTPPTITLIGSNPLSLTVGDTFVDPGATANDAEDGNLTASIIVTGTVNTATANSTSLTYSVTDSGGLSTSTVRTIVVNSIPACSDNADNDSDGEIDSEDSGCHTDYDPSNPDSYDPNDGDEAYTPPSGNTPPTIVLVGGAMNITKGGDFTDPGATASDTEDGDLTASIVVTGTVDTSAEGTYTLTYSVTDSGGLSASVSRSVTVSSGSGDDDNGGGGGGGGGDRSGRRHTIVTIPTTCSYLRDYLKIGWQNDEIEMLKLQSFLNKFEDENLELTGIFDQPTFDAVSRFQNKYKEDILVPWGHNAPTGFVYILTKKKINEIYCNTIINLSQGDRNEIEAFRALIESGRTFEEIGQEIGYSGQNETTIGQTGNVFDDTAGAVVVELKDKIPDKGQSTTTSTTTSIMKNLAVSLFALPQKIFSDSKYAILLLILVAIALAIYMMLKGPGQEITSSSLEDTTKDILKNSKPKIETENPVIILPGAILEDEEIAIKDSEDEAAESAAELEAEVENENDKS